MPNQPLASQVVGRRVSIYVIHGALLFRTLDFIDRNPRFFGAFAKKIEAYAFH
jgi:hypothetical protein